MGVEEGGRRVAAPELAVHQSDMTYERTGKDACTHGVRLQLCVVWVGWHKQAGHGPKKLKGMLWCSSRRSSKGYPRIPNHTAAMAKGARH